MKPILAPFIAFLFSVVLFGCRNKKAPEMSGKQLVYIQYFCEGDTLYPDYVCPDTLIVVDERGLNKGMALIEQGFIDGSDGDIDSILHTNCKLLNP